MKARVFLLGSLVLVMVLVGGALATPVVAGGATVPFSARIVTHPDELGFDPTTGILTVAIPGEGLVLHMGAMTFYADMEVDTTPEPGPLPWTQWGMMTLTAANGDSLFGSFAGYAIPNESGVNFWGEFWITEGDGHFTGATASGTYEGAVAGESGMLYFDGLMVK